ncbi:MAG: hypothetical protein AAF802_07890 [Planctomycetota bacterium]
MSPSKLEKLDPGRLLPGCSLPVQKTGTSAVHAFRSFRGLSFDGLDAAGSEQLAGSFREVIRSLSELHASGVSYGRITSQSFHNRGTESRPEATLWFDPAKADKTDVVHSGDAEAMYWRPQRLSHGEPAAPIDDWYALGIVLAELHLTPAAVQTIWEHSQQEGDFTKRLQKNLRQSKRGPFRAMASALLPMAEHGGTDERVLQQLVDSDAGKRLSLWPWLASAAAVAIAAALFIDRGNWNERVELARSELNSLQQELDQSSERTMELERQLAQRTVPSVEISDNPTPAAIPKDDSKEIWTETIAGRSIEDAIKQSSQSDALLGYTGILQSLVAVPGQREWRRADAVYRRLVQRVVDQPWDEKHVEAASERSRALAEAWARWSKWANGGRSIEELKTQQQLMPGGPVKDLLGEWLGEALGVHDFDLVCIREAKPDEDADWTAFRIGFEAENDSGETDWQWTLSPDSKEEISLSVDNFEAGQALSLWLVRDSSIPLWDKTILEHEFRSPLLVWRLGRGIKLKSETTGYEITVTTTRRAGPPPRLHQATEPSGSPGFVVPNDSENRREIDPKDLLPFSAENE